MTKPVCVGCRLLLKLTKIGIYLVEMVEDRPYRIWSADLCTCPRCGVEIVARFGSRCISEHWMPDFPGWMKVVEEEGGRKFWDSPKEELESREASHDSVKSPVLAGSPDEEVERTKSE